MPRWAGPLCRNSSLTSRWGDQGMSLLSKCWFAASWRQRPKDIRSVRCKTTKDRGGCLRMVGAHCSTMRSLRERRRLLRQHHFLHLS